jgi:hypothetical protein
MAIALALEFAGGTQEQYDRVMDKLGMKGTENWPQGIILHLAGPTEKGWEVVDVWESRQDFDRFLAERLGRAVLEAGLPAPTPKEFTVYNSMGLRSPAGAGRR